MNDEHVSTVAGEDNRKTCLTITEKERSDKNLSGIGIRHQIAVIACFICFNMNALRTNLGLTMVSMVNNSARSELSSNESECLSPGIASDNASYVTDIQDGAYDWDEKTQGILLGSVYYGYIITQIPGGRMAEVFGPKIVVGIGMSVASICTLVTPVSADLHTAVLLVVRIVLGLSQGVVVPCIHFLIGKWIPRTETTTMGAFIYGGLIVGLILSMAISGVLCSSDFLGGWPSVYYVFGASGCISTVLWFIFVYDSPAVHPTITEKERKRIESSVGLKKKLKIPYKSIITSPAVWAICVAHLSHAWGYFTILTCFPTYMNRIQKYDVTKSGILMSVIFALCWFISIINGLISDMLRRREWLSTVHTRKLFNSLGAFLGALCLMLIKVAGCDYVAVIALIVSSTALAISCESGYNVNHIDIAPNFAGSLYGISNTLATAPGIISPYLVGVLTQNNQTMEQWQVVFYITAAIYTVGGLFFLVFAEGVLQKWNG